MPRRSTTDRYRYIFELVCRDAPRHADSDRGIALAAEISRRSLTKASRQFYASAIRYCLENDEVQLAAFNGAMTTQRPANKPKKRRQAYEVPPALLTAVLDALEENRRAWSFAGHLKALVIGTRHFGLRPCEWERAFWKDESKSVLVVTNAKFADTVMERGPQKGAKWRRGNGIERELRIQKMYHGTLTAIADNAMEVGKHSPYSNKVNGAMFRRTHRWAIEAVRETGLFQPSILKRITIYSYRHTFSAEAKASLDLSRGEVAALMGHISTKTAVQSYARRSAKGGLKVRPTPESVEAVLVKDKALSKPQKPDVKQNAQPDNLIEKEWPHKGPTPSR